MNIYICINDCLSSVKKPSFGTGLPRIHNLTVEGHALGNSERSRKDRESLCMDGQPRNMHLRKQALQHTQLQKQTLVFLRGEALASAVQALSDHSRAVTTRSQSQSHPTTWDGKGVRRGPACPQRSPELGEAIALLQQLPETLAGQVPASIAPRLLATVAKANRARNVPL